MFRLSTLSKRSRTARRRLGALSVSALSLIALLSCGEGASLVAPDSTPPAEDRAAQGTALDPSAGSGGAPSALLGLSTVDDLSDFSTDGVLKSVHLPNLLHRQTGKWIQADAGGFVELNGFRVDVPAGALSQDTYVTIKLPLKLPQLLYVVADFGPTGTTFRQPVQVTLPLDGVDLSGIDPASLNVSYWDGSSWMSYGGTVHSGSISAGTTHFSTYGARDGVDTPSGD